MCASAFARDFPTLVWNLQVGERSGNSPEARNRAACAISSGIPNLCVRERYPRSARLRPVSSRRKRESVVSSGDHAPPERVQLPDFAERAPLAGTVKREGRHPRLDQPGTDGVLREGNPSSFQVIIVSSDGRESLRDVTKRRGKRNAPRECWCRRGSGRSCWRG